MDVRGHEHVAKVTVINSRQLHGKITFGRLINLNAKCELPVLFILSGNYFITNHKIEIRLMLRHAPDSFAAMDRNFAAYRQIKNELPGVIRFHEDNRKQ